MNSCRELRSEILKYIWNFSHLFVPLTLGQVRLHLENKRKNIFFFVFCSVCTNFSLREKVLPFGNSQIYLEFLSLIRTFAA